VSVCHGIPASQARSRPTSWPEGQECSTQYPLWHLKIVREEILISCGEFVTSKAWEEIRASLPTAVKAVPWPPGSNTFTIYPESGKKRGEGNGVKPIEVGLMLDLEKLGWKVQQDTAGSEIQASLTQCLKLSPGLSFSNGKQETFLQAIVP
jgi:hypothetical protein